MKNLEFVIGGFKDNVNKFLGEEINFLEICGDSKEDFESKKVDFFEVCEDENKMVVWNLDINDFYKNGNEGCSRYSIVEKIKDRNREKFKKEKYIKIRFIEVEDSIFMYCYR